MERRALETLKDKGTYKGFESKPGARLLCRGVQEVTGGRNPLSFSSCGVQVDRARPSGSVWMSCIASRAAVIGAT